MVVGVSIPRWTDLRRLLVRGDLGRRCYRRIRGVSNTFVGSLQDSSQQRDEPLRSGSATYLLETPDPLLELPSSARVGAAPGQRVRSDREDHGRGTRLDRHVDSPRDGSMLPLHKEVVCRVAALPDEVVIGPTSPAPLVGYECPLVFRVL